MQLGELATNRELCERLEQLGFPQNSSLACWVYVEDGPWVLVYRDRINYLEKQLKAKIVKIIAAPLEGELLDRIPFSIIVDVYGDKTSLMFHFVKMATNFYCASYVNATNYNDLYFLFKSKRPANALTRATIWLIENGHVKFDSEVE